MRCDNSIKSWCDVRDEMTTFMEAYGREKKGSVISELVERINAAVVFGKAQFPVCCHPCCYYHYRYHSFFITIIYHDVGCVLMSLQCYRVLLIGIISRS
jgi:hypothetical protein